MKIALPSSAEEAVAIQLELRKRVRIRKLRREVRLAAGIDCAFEGDIGYCAVLLFDVRTWELLESGYHRGKISFPYIPGMLSFREIPLILPALEKLTRTPDLLYVDGQGIMHPRGIGLASHLGVITGIPSVGCAKSRLCGTFREPGHRKGAAEPVLDGNGRQMGWVLRSRDNIEPLFVSPGHLLSMGQAKDFCLFACLHCRLPEPTRLADHAVAVFKKKNSS